MNKLKLNKCITCGQFHYCVTRTKQCLPCYAHSIYKDHTNIPFYKNVKYQYTNHPDAINYINTKLINTVKPKPRKEQYQTEPSLNIKLDETQLDNLSKTLQKITIARAIKNK